MATFKITNPSDKSEVNAIVVPRVTRDLPVQPVQLNSSWNGLYLSDPDFGILLGVDVYASAMLQGRRSGQPGTPVARSLDGSLPEKLISP